MMQNIPNRIQQINFNFIILCKVFKRGTDAIFRLLIKKVRGRFDRLTPFIVHS